jgi:hypothetical protein
MNKELIKKYKAEFEHWLDGGDLLRYSGRNWNEVKVSFRWETKGFIIINDKYVELRKALAEGKVVQQLYADEPTSGCLTEHWDDFTCFGYPTQCYRIKPEEPIHTIDGKVQVYLEDYNDHGLKKLFDKDEGYRYVFRHSDCRIVFTTDGTNIFATDMDNKNYELFRDGNFNLSEYYNDFNEFLDTFQWIEKLIERDLLLSNWSYTHSITINELSKLSTKPEVGEWCVMVGSINDTSFTVQRWSAESNWVPAPFIGELPQHLKETHES